MPTNGVFAWTKGEEELSQCRHFAEEGERAFFRDFVRTSFKDGPFKRIISFNFKVIIILFTVIITLVIKLHIIKRV